MNQDDPFDLWANADDAPKESELDRTNKGYTEIFGENGELTIQITPSVYARQFAASMAGTFKALQDTNEFNREEALKVLLQSMSAVVIHAHPDEDDDEDD